LVASVKDTTEVPSDFHKLWQGGLATGEPADAVERWTERRAVGREMVDVHHMKARDGRWTSEIAALPRKAGTRVVTCVAKSRSDPCGAVLDLLASTPWQDGAVADAAIVEAPSLRALGQQVRVPPKCTGNGEPRGGGRIECPPFFVQWAQLGDEAQGQRMLDRWYEMVRTRLGGDGTVATRDEIQCKVSGVEATCTRVRLRGQRPGDRLVVLAAIARGESGLIWADCIAFDRTPVPSPCSVLFSGP
jgi:hypothetical protein